MDHYHMITTLGFVTAIGVLLFWLRAISKQMDEVIDKHNNLATLLTAIIVTLEEEEHDDEQLH